MTLEEGCYNLINSKEYSGSVRDLLSSKVDVVYLEWDKKGVQLFLSLY